MTTSKPNGPAGGAPPPLPPEWLPAPLPPEGDPAWEGPLTRLLAAAEPELARRMRSPGPPVVLPWWTEMGRWWRPAGLAAAAALLLLTTVSRTPPSALSVGPEALALSLVAAEGDPSVLWHALGEDADPVLALLTFQDHGATSSSQAPSLDPGDPR